MSRLLCAALDVGQHLDHAALIICERPAYCPTLPDHYWTEAPRVKWLDHVFKAGERFPYVYLSDMRSLEDAKRLRQEERVPPSSDDPATRLPPSIVRVGKIVRFPLGTSYTDVVDTVATEIERLTRAGDDVDLVLDSTGVGNAVSDMLKARWVRSPWGNRRLDPVSITITGGQNVVAHNYYRLSVAKGEIIHCAIGAMDANRIRWPSLLREVGTLKSELKNYQLHYSKQGHEQFDARHDHDDLVIALSLGVWWHLLHNPPQKLLLFGDSPPGIRVYPTERCS